MLTDNVISIVPETKNQQSKLDSVEVMITQVEQSAAIYQQLIEVVKSLARKQEVQQKDINEAKEKASKAYDSICINDEEQAELHRIKDEKIASICTGHNLRPSKYFYSIYWRDVNRSCNVSTYKKIKRKDFEKARLTALSWKPEWLQ